MTEEVKPKRGRKPKVVEPVVEKVEVVETPVEEVKEPEVTEQSQEAPETPVEAVESKEATEAKEESEDAPEAKSDAVEGESDKPAEETTEEAPEQAPEVVESKPEDAEPTLEGIHQITQETFDALVAPVAVELADTFRPILRPSSVKGEPVGHMPVPKTIFDLVTKDADWQSKIDASTSKVGLQSVLYWVKKNGKVQVRCMSSSKFGDVL